MPQENTDNKIDQNAPPKPRHLRNRTTSPLPAIDLETEEREVSSMAGLAINTDPQMVTDYMMLPAGISPANLTPNIPCWRIEIHAANLKSLPIGLDIAGDTVLGRGKSGDLNLDEYQALELGVSRRHALLRPTARRLYLLDLDSTNGTQINSIPVGAGVARALADNDAISLGGLNFTVKIISGPEQLQ